MAFHEAQEWGSSSGHTLWPELPVLCFLGCTSKCCAGEGFVSTQTLLVSKR